MYIVSSGLGSSDWVSSSWEHAMARAEPSWEKLSDDTAVLYLLNTKSTYLQIKNCIKYLGLDFSYNIGYIQVLHER